MAASTLALVAAGLMSAPHVWLGRADAALSTVDLIGAGFTLLAAADAGGPRRRTGAVGPETPP